MSDTDANEVETHDGATAEDTDTTHAEGSLTRDELVHVTVAVPLARLADLYRAVADLLEPHEAARGRTQIGRKPADAARGRTQIGREPIESVEGRTQIGSADGGEA